VITEEIRMATRKVIVSVMVTVDEMMFGPDVVDWVESVVKAGMKTRDSGIEGEKMQVLLGFVELPE
jgi:hypothetical protein